MKASTGQEFDLSNTRRHSSRFIDEMIDSLKGFLQQHLNDLGVQLDETLAQRIATDCLEKIRKKYGKTVLYFPGGLYIDINNRRKSIYDNFHGTNIRELAMHHGIAERTVRRDLKIEEARRRELV